jgi:hypothetical protein
MSPSEDTRSAKASPGQQPHRDAAIPPMTWIRGTGIALFLAGMVVGQLSVLPGAGWPEVKVACLLWGLGEFLFAAVPGLLVALGHPWAAGLHQRFAQRLRHPRLAGVAHAWAGIVVSGWLCAVPLLYPVPPQYPFPYLPVTYAVLLVGFGSFFALLLVVDMRRR